MAPENIQADLGELGGYSAKASGLSERIGSIAGRHLADQHIGADLLGDLGEESGLHGHIAATVQTLHGAANSGASYVGSLGEAVAGARDDYHADERSHADAFRKIERERLDGK